MLGAGDPLSRDLAAGDPRLGEGGPGWTIPCEFVGNRNAHETGALTMLTSGPDTGGSLFGIVLAEEGLHDRDGAHTVFGMVVHGFEVARRLEVGDRFDRLRVEE
jgi:peptidyl-prolyl cis-trans isomerase B (cyclophilin B)